MARNAGLAGRGRGLRTRRRGVEVSIGTDKLLGTKRVVSTDLEITSSSHRNGSGSKQQLDGPFPRAGGRASANAWLDGLRASLADQPTSGGARRSPGSASELRVPLVWLKLSSNDARGRNRMRAWSLQRAWWRAGVAVADAFAEGAMTKRRMSDALCSSAESHTRRGLNASPTNCRSRRSCVSQNNATLLGRGGKVWDRARGCRQEGVGPCGQTRTPPALSRVKIGHADKSGDGTIVRVPSWSLHV